MTRVERLDMTRSARDRQKTVANLSNILEKGEAPKSEARPEEKVLLPKLPEKRDTASASRSTFKAETPKSGRSLTEKARARTQTPDSLGSAHTDGDSGIFFKGEEDTEASRRMSQKSSLLYAKEDFDVVLSDKEKRMRELAAEMELNICDVEDIEREFTRFDEDGSGQIEYGEFRSLISVLLKAKPEDIPERRMQQLWAEIDSDKSGNVDFEEFLEWYAKYFLDDGQSNIGGNPMEQFYAGFGKQRMSRARRDIDAGGVQFEISEAD